jgi:ATP-dependent DNA helicase PIF1
MPSILDNYTQRPADDTFEGMTLLHFAQNYTMPKELGTPPKHQKMRIVIVRPFCSPDPSGPKYEQYCQQKLMLHVPFRHLDQLKGTCDSFSESYAIFLQSGNIPPSLEDDIRRLTEHQLLQQQEDEEEPTATSTTTTNDHRAQEEWMLICHRHADFSNTNDCDDDHDWSASSSLYPNMEEFASFITRHRQSAPDRIFTTTADPSNLQGKQLATYNLIKDHMESNNPISHHYHYLRDRQPGPGQASHTCTSCNCHARCHNISYRAVGITCTTEIRMGTCC